MMSLLSHFPPSYPLFSRVFFSNLPKNHAFLRIFLIFLKKSPLFSYFFAIYRISHYKITFYSSKNHVFLRTFASISVKIMRFFVLFRSFDKKSRVFSYFYPMPYLRSSLSAKNHAFFRTFPFFW